MSWKHIKQGGESNHQWKGGVPTSVCLYCGNEFKSYDVRRGGGKYCSRECKYDAMRGQVVFIVCDLCGEVFQRKIYDVNRGLDSDGAYCSVLCAARDKQKKWRDNNQHPLAGKEFSSEHKRKIRASTPRGNRHYNWLGGITDGNHKERNSVEFKEWSRAVLRRDKYTCQYCGKVGGLLHAHHVHSFAKYPELRYYIENGITLCKKCHDTNHPGQYERVSSGGAGPFFSAPSPVEVGCEKEI